MAALALLPVAEKVFGSDTGKDTYRQSSFGDTSKYNPNAFQYGGQPGVADLESSRLGLMANYAQGRDPLQADYSGANAYAQQGLESRGQQAQMAGLMAARAQGLVPSIAQMQADRQMRQATAEQASAAASARGAAGLALAQQNAAGNVANLQSAISNQAQINAAQERMMAEQNALRRV